MEQLRSMLDGLRTYWENLTERERRLLSGLGAVLAALVVVVPVFLLSRSINQLEAENEELSSALRLLSRSRGEIAAMRAEQTARDARYALGAPGEEWLPAQAEERGLSIARVQHQPPRAVDDFTVHTTRASFSNVGLRAPMLLLEDLKNSPYPVAIERVHVDHRGSGDTYNIELGVLTFSRQGATGSNADAGVPQPRSKAAR